MWVTCLPPFGQFDVGVLGEIRDAVGNDEASLVEGRKGESSRLRGVCWFRFTQKILSHCLIDTETVHGPATERVCPQSQIGHQALCTKDAKQGKQSGWLESSDQQVI